MDSTKEEVKAIAERMARDRNRMPSEQNSGFDWYDDECDKIRRKRRGYQAAIELTLPHILSLMARVKHEHGCERDRWNHGENLGRAPICSCGLDAELKSIESLIHQTT